MNDMVPTGRTAQDAKAELSGLLRKIRGLLDKAEGTDNEHEAKAFREHAETLMRKYRIDQEALLAVDATAEVPSMETVDICPASSVFAQEYINLFHQCAHHAGIRVRYIYSDNKYVGQAVGYSGDIRYATFIYTSARLTFMEKLEPQLKPELSEAENIYRLRSAGIDRQRIAEMVWGKRGQREGEQVSKIYQKVCAERGENPKVVGRGVNIKTYRTVYSRQFTSTLARRLREARDGADTVGGALVLHGRQERVDEAFYERFPEYRPSSAPRTAEDKPTKKSRKKAWTAADEARYQRMNHSAAALAGMTAGTEAASEVEIERTARAKRIEAGWHPDWSDLQP